MQQKNRRRVCGAVAVIAVSLLLAGCQEGQVWRSCNPAPDGNRSGTDGTYVLWCKDFTWQPIMTVDEYVRILNHEPVTIGPLPDWRPTLLVMLNEQRTQRGLPALQYCPGLEQSAQAHSDQVLALAGAGLGGGLYPPDGDSTVSLGGGHHTRLELITYDEVHLQGSHLLNPSITGVGFGHSMGSLTFAGFTQEASAYTIDYTSFPC